MTTTAADRIVIDPVTRIEGHAKITIHLDEAGEVRDAQFHVTQFRGFERIVQGRPLHEMPSIMARICGICPVSHLVASAKACDEIIAVEPPPAGADLRRVMNLAQIAQSNALSFFHLASPDLLFGFDADAAGRNLFGVAAAAPRLARDGIAIRRFGQQVIEWLGGKRIHPSWIVPGGVDAPLDGGDARPDPRRDPRGARGERARDRVVHGRARPVRGGGGVVRRLPLRLHGARRSATAPSTTTTGCCGSSDADGAFLADRIDPRGYADLIGEAVEPWSFLKSTYWKALGYPDGVYRVGPLARVVVADRMGTPRADAELGRFRRAPRPRAQQLVPLPLRAAHRHAPRDRADRGAAARPGILSPRVRSTGGINRNEGIGVSEAPRGTLMHHYRVDDDGIVEWANLVIATGHNNLAMNRSVAQVAKAYVKSATLTEAMLNRVEAVIRCYDPCLSCSTHALGEMPLRVQLLGPDHALLDELVR